MLLLYEYFREYAHFMNNKTPKTDTYQIAIVIASGIVLSVSQRLAEPLGPLIISPSRDFADIGSTFVVIVISMAIAAAFTGLAFLHRDPRRALTTAIVSFILYFPVLMTVLYILRLSGADVPPLLQEPLTAQAVLFSITTGLACLLVSPPNNKRPGNLNPPVRPVRISKS